MRAYYHIPMATEDIHKIAETTPFGLFEFIRLPFGMRNAAQTFQRFMHHVTQGLNFIFVYVDDILVASKLEKEHEHHLKLLFQCLAEYDLRIKVSKCIFGVPTLQFLEFEVKERVTAINSFPEPKSVKNAQRFVGVVNYYHRFIPHLARYSHLFTITSRNWEKPTSSP